MASALVRLGATSAEVDEAAFAADIRDVITKLERLDVEVMIEQRGDEVAPPSAFVTREGKWLIGFD
jgi:hypothetical protein